MPIPKLCSRLIIELSQLKRAQRHAVLMIMDGVCLFFSIWAAFAIRFHQAWPVELQANLELVVIAIVFGLPLYWFFGLYRSLLRHVGLEVIRQIFLGTGMLLLILIALATLSSVQAAIPRTVWIMIFLFSLGTIAAYRVIARDVLRQSMLAHQLRRPVIIYGVGEAGVQLASALKLSHEMRVMAFVDDDPQLQGNEIFGCRVYPVNQLDELIKRLEVNALLLAMPSISKRDQSKLIKSLSSLTVEVLVMPSLTELASGARRVDELRHVAIDDILGRDAVVPNPELLKARITKKAVMVTGAGGSIGSELCRQIIRLKPNKLILFEINEYHLYQIEQELSAFIAKHKLAVELVPLLGSVLHQKRMEIIMRHFAIDAVYHAAAYKHVPIVERNMIEGVQNNIFGTLSCAQAARAAGVGTFVLISTDKAVRPTNVMGATKRFAELILQALAEQVLPHTSKPTVFCIVRFGNVLASSGSVVPLFQAQIKCGGPVTVTHPEVMRYFMTMTEAAQLVLQASSLSVGGDVFVLDMGEQIRILDLARRMIELSGCVVKDAAHPEGDIEIIFNGLRPGEKLYEELLIGEGADPTLHPMISKAHEESMLWTEIAHFLDQLQMASRAFSHTDIRQILKKAVRGYVPEGGVADWLVDVHAADPESIMIEKSAELELNDNVLPIRKHQSSYRISLDE